MTRDKRILYTKLLSRKQKIDALLAKAYNYKNNLKDNDQIVLTFQKRRKGLDLDHFDTIGVPQHLITAINYEILEIYIRELEQLSKEMDYELNNF